MYNKQIKYIRPKFSDVENLVAKLRCNVTDKDRLTFWLANIDQVSMCSGWTEESFNELIANNKIDLSQFVAGEKETAGLNRDQTKQRVLEMLSEVITADSKMTKGALIKYVRDNWKEKTIMSDVGRVASKVINEKTGHSFSKWQVCTTQRHIRKVK